jgi:hypothetical protein
VGVLEDCAEFVQLMSAGKAVFRRGSAADGLADRLVDLIAGTRVPPRTTTVFASSEDIARPELRDYLHGQVDNGQHVTVTVFDPGRFTAVDDPVILEQARDLLGVDVSRPDGEAAHLTPASTTAQREAVRTLRADPGPASQEKLSTFLTGRPAGLTDETGWLADHSGLLGVPLSLFGDEPGYDLRALDSPAPVSRTGLEEALHGTFAPVPLPQVIDEIRSGRARAALVHGWRPGATDAEMRWLVRGDDGVARWAVNGPDGVLPEFSVDGAEDLRTRLLEQVDTTTLFLAPDGTAYTPEPPAPTVVVDHGFHLSVNTRTSGRAALVGTWEPGLLTPNEREILEEVERFDGDSVAVRVRRGPALRGLSTLEPAQSYELDWILRNNTTLPLVVATENNDELLWTTTQLHERSAVQPVADGFRKVYDVMGPSGRRDRYGTLTTDVLTRGLSLARTAPDIAMPELRSMVASHTWAIGAERFREHIDAVRTEEAADQIVRMLQQHDERMLATDRLLGGTIGASPFARPEVALPAYRALVTTALRAAGDPARAGRPSIQPANAWITEPIEPHTSPVDENFLIGYLTDRPVPLQGETGAYLLGLLWLREMVQAMLSEAGGLTPADGLAVIKAKGELPGERAARSPRQPETQRAHAIITEGLIGILFPESSKGTAADRQKLLEAIDCLTGEDRVAWLYIVKNQVRPHFPAHQVQLSQLTNTIVTCH